MPDPDAQPPAAGLDRVVDDQSLAVLAAIDDLRHDLPGSIHDARVALRKLRSTLVVFRPLLDKEAAARLETDLRWLAGELGTARDAQVVRSRITTALREHDAGADGAELLDALDETTADSWDRANAALADWRIETLVVGLQQARLRSIVPSGRKGSPLRRLGAGLGDLLSRAASTTTADDETLHRLRKRVKRIRFAVASMAENAVGVLPVGSGVGRVSRALEDLQDLLGEYQDAVVTAGFLDRLSAGTAASVGLAAELAAGQRAAAAAIRETLPGGVERVRRATDRLQDRLAKQSAGSAGRTPGVHLDSP